MPFLGKKKDLLGLVTSKGFVHANMLDLHFSAIHEVRCKSLSAHHIIKVLLNNIWFGMDGDVCGYRGTKKGEWFTWHHMVIMSGGQRGLYTFGGYKVRVDALSFVATIMLRSIFLASGTDGIKWRCTYRSQSMIPWEDSLGTLHGYSSIIMQVRLTR